MFKKPEKCPNCGCRKIYDTYGFGYGDYFCSQCYNEWTPKYIREIIKLNGLLIIFVFLLGWIINFLCGD